MTKKWTIAIDGPSGAGKSTIANALAERLGVLHLDTGAMYRALACACLQNQIDPNDEQAVLAYLPQLEMTVSFENGQQLTAVNGTIMNQFLYTPEASKAASDISRQSPVRRWLVSLQQKLAETQNFILDGRDIGTCVLPRATAKFFLTASPEIRAERRWKELQAKGCPDSYQQVLSDLMARDAQDSSRADSPLKQASDAVLVDSSEMDFQSVLQAIWEELIRKDIVSETD